MTTVREVLTRAVVMTRARALGDNPAAEEMDAALTTLQGLALALLPSTHLTPVLATAAYTAGENERISNPDDYAIFLPSTVTDTYTGETRAPKDGAMVQVDESTPAKHIYVGELGGWQNLHGLTLESEQPFGPTHDEGVAAMTAVRLAPMLQQLDVPQWVAEMAASGRRLIRQKFRQTAFVQTDPLLLSKFQRYGATL